MNRFLVLSGLVFSIVSFAVDSLPVAFCSPRAGWTYYDCIPGLQECYHACGHAPACVQAEKQCSPDLVPGNMACYCGPRRRDLRELPN